MLVRWGGGKIFFAHREGKEDMWLFPKSVCYLIRYNFLKIRNIIRSELLQKTIQKTYPVLHKGNIRYFGLTLKTLGRKNGLTRCIGLALDASNYWGGIDKRRFLQMMGPVFQPSSRIENKTFSKPRRNRF